MEVTTHEPEGKTVISPSLLEEELNRNLVVVPQRAVPEWRRLRRRRRLWR